jgi:EF hand domain-containing protein
VILWLFLRLTIAAAPSRENFAAVLLSHRLTACVPIARAKGETMKSTGWLAIVLLFSMSAAMADDRETYNRRAAEADMAAFRLLDLNRDGVLTRGEVLADLNFAPRFNDIDIDRDGVITPEEMRRYIEQAYGVTIHAGPKPAAGDEIVRVPLSPASGR